MMSRVVIQYAAQAHDENKNPFSYGKKYEWKTWKQNTGNK